MRSYVCVWVCVRVCIHVSGVMCVRAGIRVCVIVNIMIEAAGCMIFYTIVMNNELY